MIVPTLLGMLAGLGLFLVVAGIGGSRTPSPPTRRASPTRRRPSHRLTGYLAVGVLTGAVVFLLTGWVVGGALAGLGAALLPHTLRETDTRRGGVARSEAIASWAEMLRDTMAGAAGIEEAVTATAPVAPLAIRDDVMALASMLERERLDTALRAFAERLHDPAADLVVAALALASQRHARDLGALLGALAGAARHEAAMVLRVEAGRSRLRTATRVVTATTLGFAALLMILSRDFLRPYDDALGQAWLLVVGGLFAAAIWQLHRMARIASAPRLLASPLVGAGA